MAQVLHFRIEFTHGDNANVDVYDPWVNAAEAQHECAITPIAETQSGTCDAVIVAVGHQQFATMGVNGICALGKPTGVIYDVKYVLPKGTVDGRL